MIKRLFEGKGRLTFVLVLFCLLILGCGHDPYYIPVTSITDVPNKAMIDTPLTLTGKVNPSFAKNQNIIWSIVFDDPNANVVPLVTLNGNTLYAVEDALGTTVTVNARVVNGKTETTDYNETFEIEIVPKTDNLPDGPVMIRGTGKYYGSLIEAVEAVGVEPVEIVILQDIIETKQIDLPNGVNITLVTEPGQKRTITVRFTSPNDFTLFSFNNTYNSITLGDGKGGELVFDGNNSRRCVSISDGTLFMNNGATITGFTDSAVYVNGGIFNMKGGEISNNNTNNGGGVFVSYGSKFNMEGGKIINNNASASGGGVYVVGTFTMTGGEISSNEAQDGGGVYISFGEFTMSGNAKIIGNIAGCGGGVYVCKTFIMEGGGISNNTAKNNGGGVYVTANASNFTMTGGTIFGINGDVNKTNKAPSGNDSDNGAAVYDNTKSIPAYNNTITVYPIP